MKKIILNICLANNIENRDCYLIIVVDEKNNFEFYPLNDDHNRKNSNELTTFLRDKKFFGGIRLIHFFTNNNC